MYKPEIHSRSVRANELRDTILEELGNQPPGAQTWLYAIVDRARLTEQAREIFDARTKRFKHARLLNNPKYKSLYPYFAVLVYAHSPSPSPVQTVRRIESLFELNSDIISGWITSHLEPEVLVAHLENATFAYKADERAYFLNYYDPFALPILRELAPREWTKWFFDPLISWWYPFDTPVEETWRNIQGGGQAMAEEPVRLVFTEELWDAFAGDPFPHTLLDVLNAEEGLAFNSDCYGVRLAQVEDLIQQGKKSGLYKQTDLVTYVRALLQAPERAKESLWEECVYNAAQDKAPLSDYFLE
jgi:hypothetical protein